MEAMEGPSRYALPWPTPQLWREANEAIAHTIRRRKGDLQALVDQSTKIRECVNALDTHMVYLCGHTCVQCQQICCRHARVYYDFKDLLCLHLGQGPLPIRQTMGKSHQTCCYLSADGCRLPRAERPFICTWYLCPDQRACLEQMASSVRIFVSNSLIALKRARYQLETDYIQTMVGPVRSGYSL